MSNELTEYKIPSAIRFEDFGLVDPAERLIQGDIMRCVDGKWSSKGGIEFPRGTRMIVAATVHVLQRWEDGLPAETIVETPSKSLPDIDELRPISGGQMGRRPKRQSAPAVARAVYRLSLRSARRRALHVSELDGGRQDGGQHVESRIARMRAFSGRHVAAVVELGERLVSKRYGKLGPMFHIVDWLPLDGGGSTAAPRQIEHAAGQLEHLAAEQPVTKAPEASAKVELPARTTKRGVTKITTARAEGGEPNGEELPYDDLPF
jgi:hypothetical protein